MPSPYVPQTSCEPHLHKTVFCELVGDTCMCYISVTCPSQIGTFWQTQLRARTKKQIAMEREKK